MRTIDQAPNNSGNATPRKGLGGRRDTPSSNTDTIGGVIPAALCVTGYSVSDSWPLFCFAATVRLDSPASGTQDFICTLTQDQRRLTSPLGISWDAGHLPVPYRRAVRHLVCDLADQVIAERRGLAGTSTSLPKSATGETEEAQS